MKVSCDISQLPDKEILYIESTAPQISFFLD